MFIRQLFAIIKGDTGLKKSYDLISYLGLQAVHLSLKLFPLQHHPGSIGIAFPDGSKVQIGKEVVRICTG